MQSTTFIFINVQKFGQGICDASNEKSFWNFFAEFWKKFTAANYMVSWITRKLGRVSKIVKKEKRWQEKLIPIVVITIDMFKGI